MLSMACRKRQWGHWPKHPLWSSWILIGEYQVGPLLTFPGERPQGSLLRKEAAVMDSTQATEQRQPEGGPGAGVSYKVKGLTMRLVQWI